MMKVLTVVGARPQFIKASAVSRAFRSSGDVNEIIVHTGQHYDANMSDVFFDDLNIPRPHHHLGIGGGSHGRMTGRQLEAIEDVLVKECPDVLLVYGDTNSTLAGALAAAKLHIPVAHIEAGLRSFNRKMPEEINRVLTDHISDLMFAPTETAVANLHREGRPRDDIYQVGDVMYDASLYFRHMSRRPPWAQEIELAGGQYVLATIHRAENTEDIARLGGILAGLGLAQVPVVLPLHPRTRAKISEFGLNVPTNIHVVSPVGYLEMIWLEANAKVIATDSGGVQKEAYFFEKPCVTLRDETEWVELVQAGWNYLAGFDADRIASYISRASPPYHHVPLYGSGDASTKITQIISGYNLQK